MRDLTERALDTASSLGAGYADVRVVRRLDESVAIKTGRVEGVASGESEGFGVRVLVDGAWGFASSHVLTAAEMDRVAGEAVRIARASATALRDPAVLDDRPPATGRYETPVDEDPFEIPLERKIGDLLAADQAASRGQGHRLHRIDVRGRARVEDVRGDRRQLHRAGHHARRHGRGGQRRRRRRAPAALLPGFRRRLERRRLRVRPLARPRRPGRAAGRRGRRAAQRPAVPVRPVHDRPRPERSSTCRSTRAAATRPSSTASSGPRRRTRGPAS